ncbi:MAG: RodZ domain-containing protein [Syntrophobacteraceae bacterium]
MRELAEFLHSERRKRGLTLETVSERCGISTGMLRCFEACDFECLDSALLLRNTIRGYCKALELDPEAFLREYATEIAKHNYQEKGLKKYARQMKTLEKKRRIVSFPLLLLAVATVVVMLAGAWISEKRARLYEPPAAEWISSQEDLPSELRQKLAPYAAVEPTGRHGAITGLPDRLAALSAKSDADFKEAEKAIRDAEKNIREAENAREAEKAKDAAEGLRASMRLDPASEPAAKVALSNSMEVMAEDKPAAATVAGNRLRFAVEADAKTWVQVIIDEKETRSAMLHPGDKREWSAQKGMQVVIGNAGGVRMKWEDQQVKAPRDPGRVLRFKLPEQLSVIGD